MNIICYTVNIANWFFKKNIPFIPKLIRKLNRIIFSCDIPPNINLSTKIIYGHHGLGIVINQNAKIKSGTTILQGVTIGGAGKNRLYNGEYIVAPVIGHKVFIGSHAQIIGPIIIGDNSTIGAGAIVTKDVPAGTTVAGNPAKMINSPSHS